MAFIKIVLDKEKGEIKLDHKDLTPIEALKVLLSASQTITKMFDVKNEEVSKIIKPNQGTINKIKNLSTN